MCTNDTHDWVLIDTSNGHLNWPVTDMSVARLIHDRVSANTRPILDQHSAYTHGWGSIDWWTIQAQVLWSSQLVNNMYNSTLAYKSSTRSEWRLESLVLQERSELVKLPFLKSNFVLLVKKITRICWILDLTLADGIFGRIPLFEEGYCEEYISNIPPIYHWQKTNMQPRCRLCVDWGATEGRPRADRADDRVSIVGRPWCGSLVTINTRSRVSIVHMIRHFHYLFSCGSSQTPGLHFIYT